MLLALHGEAHLFDGGDDPLALSGLGNVARPREASQERVSSRARQGERAEEELSAGARDPKKLAENASGLVDAMQDAEMEDVREVLVGEGQRAQVSLYPLRGVRA